MSPRAEPVDERIDVPGSAPAAVARRIVLAMAQDPAYEGGDTGDGRLRYTRVRRPGWAAGLVKRLEVCEITLERSATGTVVRVTGQFTVERLVAVRGAAGGRSVIESALDARHGEVDVLPDVPSIAPPSSPAPPPPVGDGTVLRDRPRPAPAPAPTARALVRLVVGDDEAPLGEGVVIGRDPRPPDERPARPLAVSDPSVSKTHALFLPSGDGVLVEDLHSTNGTRALDANGRATSVAPGTPVVIGPGSRLWLGDLEVRVEPPAAPRAT